MDIWDQLCRLLRARVVSVEDVSNKARPAPRAPRPLCQLAASGMSRAAGRPPHKVALRWAARACGWAAWSRAGRARLRPRCRRRVLCRVADRAAL